MKYETLTMYRLLEEMPKTLRSKDKTQSECGDKFIGCSRILLAVDPMGGCQCWKPSDTSQERVKHKDSIVDC